MTDGEMIFRKNAARVRRELGGRDVVPLKATMVEIVRACLATRRPPSYHRRAWLERREPALLSYLDEIADTNAWRTLVDRVRETPPADQGRSVWLSRIAGTLHDLTRIGRAILDRNETAERTSRLGVIPAASSGESGDGGSNGDAGKAGKAGTVAKPTPAPRSAATVLRLRVPLTDAERRALGLDEKSEPEAETMTPATDGPEGADDPAGMSGLKPGGAS